MATGKSLHMMMEEDAAAKAEEPARRKLVVLATDGERYEIEKAITLWQALHGDVGGITPGLRGETIAAILATWRRDEAERLRGA